MFALIFVCVCACLSEKSTEEYDAQFGDAKYTAEEGFGLCGQFLIVLSYLLLLIGMPFTLCCCLKVLEFDL